METNNNVNDVVENNANDTSKEKLTDNKMMDFNFFKCCSASLKRFSFIIFIINLFFALALTGVAIVLVSVYLGVNTLSLLALPIFTVFLLLVVIARFISALIYGFAEIVENNEKNN